MDKPTLTYKIGDKTIRWTYGLQLDIQRLVPDAESAIQVLMSDAFTRDYLVRRALTDVKKSVTDETELVQIEDIEFDPDEILGLLDWVSGHLLYFFAKSATNLMARSAALKENLPSQPSASGSEG